MKSKILLTKIGLISVVLLSAMSASAFLFQKEITETDSAENQETAIDQKPIELSENDQLTVDLVNGFAERLENQEKVDAMIQAEVESGYYTPENPLVILDPYSQSPLTALICFTTDEPTRVDIHVEGEDEYTEVNHSFSEFTTQHVIPVYGLYPEKLNPVTVTVFGEKDRIVGKQVSEIQTEPVSDHFQNLIILTETFEEGYQEGINFLYQTGKLAFDKNGAIRWYFSENTYRGNGEYGYEEGHLIATMGKTHAGTIFIFEIDKLGGIHKIMYSEYGGHHDITPSKDYSLLMLGTNTIGNTVEDFIYEINVMTGEIENTLDMKYVIQRNRPSWSLAATEGKKNRQDWMHMNSIEYDEADDTIIVSSNYQSAVIKMDWPSGDIHWVLGNHNDWNPRMQQYLLTPIGEEFEWPYNQHAAEILPDYDNNPDTIDILLFDNGSTRFAQDEELQRQIRNNEIVEPELYSRLVHYRINEVTMEVEQIWQYGKERGTELFSIAQSDADLLENENILGMFYRSKHPILSEVNKDSVLIWEAEVFLNTESGDRSEYRAERLPFYFDDDGEHDIYSTARNLIPEDIMQFVADYNATQ